MAILINLLTTNIEKPICTRLCIIFGRLPMGTCAQLSLQILRGLCSLNWLMDMCQILKSVVKLTGIWNEDNMAANMSPNPR